MLFGLFPFVFNCLTASFVRFRVLPCRYSTPNSLSPNVEAPGAAQTWYKASRQAVPQQGVSRYLIFLPVHVTLSYNQARFGTAELISFPWGRE